MSDTMLAGRLDLSGDKPALKMEQLPIPEPAEGEVRVKVMSAGVCLSDIHLLSGQIKPLYLDEDDDIVTLGHEVSGVIDKLGAKTQGASEGKRVLLRAGRPVGDRTLTMGLDYNGGWAEYVVVPDYSVISIPDNISFDVASIIPDAVSTPWSAIYDTAKARPAQAVGVWGVGGLGAHAIKLLRAIGVSPLVAMDPSAEARKRADEYGADIVLDPTADDFQKQFDSALGGRKLDIAFDFAGFDAVRTQALDQLAKFGQLVLTGISGNAVTIPNDIVFQINKNELKGHYGSNEANLHQLINLVEHDRVNFDASITEVLPLSEAPKAVEHLENKVGNPIRIVLHPQES